MLKIMIPKNELWNESKEEFIITNERELCLEHSLYSISKWEQKWHKPFLSKDEKTVEETISYIKCMLVEDIDEDDNILSFITNDIIDKIQQYINDSMTATWFNDKNDKPGREIITAEIIYYWMMSLGIDMECERWHFNKLMTLIKVFEVKNKKPKKMSKSEIIAEHRRLNEERRKACKKE